MIGSLGFPELLFILVLALLIFGPRKLPEIGRTLGRALGEFRRATSDLKRTLDTEMTAEEYRLPTGEGTSRLPRRAAEEPAGGPPGEPGAAVAPPAGEEGAAVAPPAGEEGAAAGPPDGAAPREDDPVTGDEPS